ncbi:MAG: Ig-like domain-containing protein [Treponema sp.]|nr:Ig-like domain-containing protein [Treponema sp.]
MNRIVKKLIVSLGGILLLTSLATSCKNWMASDQFLSAIESDVSVANAQKINVYLRYANTKMGTTAPVNSDWLEEKVGVSFSISATTNDDYAFVKWAAFSVEDFPTSKQYSNFIYSSYDDYKKNYSGYEYSSEEVKFTDPYSNSTTVTVNVESDRTVFIMPIVSARPVYVTSNPEDNATNVVKNMTVRILFSKPLDESSLTGAFTVSQGPIVLSESNSDYVDITDNFQEPILSKSKKMVTLQQKEGPESNPQLYYFDAFQKILINISNEIRDSDGNAMAEGATITFKTNDKTDTVAPKITVLKASTILEDDSSVDFSSAYDYADSVNGGSTRIQPSAISDFDAALQTYFKDANNKETRIAAMYSQRTTGHVYLDIEATEYTEDSGTATGDDASGSTITINSTLVVNADGTIADNGSNKESIYTYSDASSYTFISGNNNAVTSDVTYKEEVDEFGNVKSVKGILVDYDLNFQDKLNDGQEVPDGLYRIDIWAVDANGNDGSTQNRITSMYVIKDTTPPDVTTEAKKVETYSDSAPYAYYNAETLATLKFKVGENKEIVDSTTEKLACDVSKIKWLFSTSSTSPKASDSNWSYITQDTSGKVFSTAKAPESDGPASVYVFLMDDMNNISQAQELDSVYYDNTVPEIGTIEWISASTLTADAPITVNSTQNQYMEKALRIPFTEAYSGLKRLTLEIKNESGTSVSTNPIASGENATEIYYLNSDLQEALKLDWESKTDSDGNTFVELQIPSSSELTNLTSGYLFIANLHFSQNLDAILNLKFNLYDAALNKTADMKTTFSYDNTAPLVESITLNDLVESTPYDGSASKQFLSKKGFTIDSSSRIQNTASITLEIKESGSGVNVITLKDDINLTSNTIVLLGQEEIDSSQYQLDTSKNTITFTDFIEPVLQSDSSFEVTIKNLHYANTGSTKNKANIQLTDFILKSSTTSDSDTPDLYVDNSNPVFESITIKDLDSTNTETNTKYTNQDTVNLIVKLKSESDSGLKTITLTNAKFTDDSKIYLGNDATGTEIASTISSDKTTLTLTKVASETSSQTYFITNLKFTDSSNGKKTISLTAKDLVGWESESTSASITLDNVAPELSGDLSWVVTDGKSTAGITNQNIISGQKLLVPFTEVTSGISSIKFVVTDNTDTVYQTPVVYDSAEKYFTLTYVNGDDTSSYGTTSSSEPGDSFTCNGEKTGTYEIQNIAIADNVTEGTYTIKVILTDIAENVQTVEKTIEISNDSTKPVVSKIEIEELIKAGELGITAGSNLSDTYWVTSDYLDLDSGTTKLSLYITINETNSGLKTLTLGSPSTNTNYGSPCLSTNSAIYLVGESGLTEISSSTYSLSSNKKIITFTSGNSNLKGENLKFKITNVAFNKQENINLISVKASDLALNESESVDEVYLKDSQTSIQSGTTGGFYFNTTSPQISTLTLVDRETTNGIAAQTGYTNEQIVDLKMELYMPSDSMNGYNSFTLDGAKFIKDGSDASIITIGTTEITSDSYEISDDLKTITFKNSDGPKVLRSSSCKNLTFENILLDSDENTSQTIGVTTKDLSGMESAKKTYNITLDTEEPLWDGATKEDPTSGYGPYVYGNGATDLNFVYPRPTGGTSDKSAIGVHFNTKNSAGTYIRYFYKYPNKTFRFGMDFTDNVALRDNSTSGSESLLYIKSSDSSDYTNLAVNTTSTTSLLKVSGSSDTSKQVVANLASGTYVVADKAGNISKEYTFNIVEDYTRPISSAGYNAIRYATLALPDDGANVYRPDSVTSTSYVDSTTEDVDSTTEDNYDFKDAGKNSCGDSLYSYHYVKRAGKYKIVVKYATGLTTADIQISGNNTPSRFGALSDDVVGSTTSAPLDYYSVTHWYGVYPYINSNTIKYQPAFPNNTTTPSGQTIQKYFGFEANETLGDADWDTEHSTWHKYKKDSGDYTDGDNHDTIVSRVNSEGNIEIDIPDTNIPPLTLLLKDGCGNLNYMVLTFYDDRVTKANSDGQGESFTAYYGVSFYTDPKLGNSSDTRKVLQNVAAYTGGGASEYTFGDTSYKWGNQTSSYTDADGKGGTSELGYLMRDNVEKLTYYNPSNSHIGTKLYKIALTVNGETGKTFDSCVPTTDTSEYTARAKILWTTESGTPSYSDFSGTNTSDWLYCQASSNGDVHFFFDYPTSLTQGTPYYFWYLVEDRVGNYDINTIVNDLDDEYNRWVYDAKAPTIKVRYDGRSPWYYSLSEVDKLVPANNGYKSYQNGKNAYVWGPVSRRSSAEFNRMEGNGLLTRDTTLDKTGFDSIFSQVEYSGGTFNYEYLPAFDLDITDTTGIYAYFYVVLPPSEDLRWPSVVSPKTIDSYNSVTSDTSSSPWFYGKGVEGCLREIGSAISDTNYKVYAYRSSGKYEGTFTGTKILPQVPVLNLNESSSSTTGSRIALFVMDWVGNIDSCPLGSFGTSGPIWFKDSTAPTGYSYSDTDIQYLDSYVEGSHYIKREYSESNGYYINYLRIAGSGKDENSPNLKIYIPISPLSTSTDVASGWYYDKSGSGIAGFDLRRYDDSGNPLLIDIGNACCDDNGPYLELSYSDYSFLTSLAENEKKFIAFNIYDNVGNCSYGNFTSCIDSTPPDLSPTISLSNSDYLHKKGHTGKYTKSFSLSSTEENGKIDSSKIITSSKTPEDDDWTTYSDIYYVDPTGASSLRIQCTNGAEWASDTRALYLKKWSGSAWDAASAAYSSSSATTSLSLSYASEAYYQFSISDMTGNTTYYHFKTVSDTTMPAFKDGYPKVVPTKGIAQVNGDTLYYNQIDVQVSGTDEGSGVRSCLYRTNISRTNKFITDSNKYDFTDLTFSSDFYTSGWYTKEDPTTIPLNPEVEGTKECLWVGIRDGVLSYGDSSYDYNCFTPKMLASTYNATYICHDETAPTVKEGTFTAKYQPHYIEWDSDKFNTTYDSDASTLLMEITDSRTTKVTYTPAAQDSSGILGWIVQDNEEKPTVDSSTDLADLKTSFTYTCGTGNDIPLDTSEVVKYYFAVDYAGNVSDPIAVTYKYSNKYIPEITDISYEGIVQVDSVNYYKSPVLTFTVSSGVKSTPQSILITWSDSDYEEYDFDDNTVTGPISSDGKYIYTCKLSKLPSGLSGNTLSAWVSNKYSYSAQEKELTYSGVNSYTEETDVPNVTKAEISANSEEKTYYDSDSDPDKATLYFNPDQTSISLTVTGITDATSGYYNSSLVTDEADLVMPESESTAISITAPSSDSAVYKLYAWDKVGNYKFVKDITFVKDSTATEIQKVTPSSNVMTGFYYNSDSDAKKFFWNGEQSITFTSYVNDSDNDISYYYYNDDKEDNRSTSGEFTITPSAEVTEYNFYAVDRVGNVSQAYTITSVNDTSAPEIPTVTFGSVDDIYPVDNNSTALTSGKVYYIKSSTYSENGIGINISSSDTGSGLSSVGIEGQTAAATYTLKPSEQTTYTIKATDKLGNSSTFTLIISPDSIGPQPTGTSSHAPNYGGGTTPKFDSDGDGVAEAVLGVVGTDGSYTATGTINPVYGSGLENGSEYSTNFYDEGLQLNVPVASDDIVAFGLVTGPSSSEDPTKPTEWTEISESNYSEGILTVTVPEITDEYSFIFLWMKDRVNNLSVFNLGNPSNCWSNWWIQNTPSTSASYSVSAGSYSNSNGTPVANVAVSISGLSSAGAISQITLEGLSTTQSYEAYSQSSTATLTWAVTSIVVTTSETTYTVDSTNAVLNCENNDGTLTFKDSAGNAHPYLHTGGIVTVNLTCSGSNSDYNLINAGASAPTPTLTSVTDFGGNAVTPSIANGSLRSRIARGLTSFTSKVKSSVGFTSRTRVEKVASNKTSSVRKQKTPVKVAEVKELPTSTIQDIPEFQSEDIKAQLNRSFQAGTIALDQITSDNNQGTSDSLKKNQGSIQNVAPLFVDDANNKVKLENRVTLSKADGILEVSEPVANIDWVLIITVLVGVVIFAICAVSMIRRLTKKGE